MRGHWHRFAILLVVVASTAWPARREQQPSSIPRQQCALHALNRLTFGARPGDLERVLSMGVDKWIDLELHPERIDDSSLATRLRNLSTLSMSPEQMVETFPPVAVIKAVSQGRHPLPLDVEERAIYRAQLEWYRDKQENEDSKVTGRQAHSPLDSGGETGAGGLNSMLESAHRERIFHLPPGQRMTAILELSAPEQQRLLRSLTAEETSALEMGLLPRQRETLMALSHPEQVVVGELVAGRLLRNIYSERQLEAVMTDFWLNHFNVFLGKGADHYLLTSYERDVIRPRALGRFRDLLVATAQSPAMLFYLDNWMSVGPDSEAARGLSSRRGRQPSEPNGRTLGRAGGGKKSSSGLNENYARELMELHTLGVKGGYSERDVTEVAKAFTGWTIRRPQEGGTFFFDSRMHQPGNKVVLGHRIKQSGEREAIEVLTFLSRSPATAKFIATKLAERFVSDDPPPALVARMEHTFVKKDGDIREVLATLFHSPEFWANAAYRAKLKTPLEFVASALRATGVDVADPKALSEALNRMGEPLYGCQQPNGYSMRAQAWMSAGALVERMHFSLALSAGKLPGAVMSLPELLAGQQVAPDGEHLLAMLEDKLLNGEISPETHRIIAHALDTAPATAIRGERGSDGQELGVIAALLLGSPDFQRR
ncbi:MAG: DUF1800 domain-containing protein [Acidobacteria bacterium]|nr:DUF1800 domain-containing protein [Acidobacteriota bacterium]